MRYNIQVEAARNTITQTRDTIADIKTANTTLKDDASGLGGSLAHSPETSGVLTGDVRQAFHTAGEALVTMIGSNISFTEDAVNHYGKADQTMRTNAQSGSQQATPPKMPGIR